MWGLTRDSAGEPKWNDDTNHGPDWRSDHSLWRNQGHRRHRWQRAPQLPREPLGGWPSSGGNSLDGQSECSSWHWNQTRVSRESSQLEWTGRGLGWRLICPILKMKRPKTQWPTTHGNGTCLCFTTPFGMTIICCPMSSDLCKDSREAWWGV